MIQPHHADRPDCPYLISAYSQYKYPLIGINKILNQIQVCEHGWLCEKCCHEYTGKFTHNATERDSNRWILMYMKRVKLTRGNKVAYLLSQLILEIFLGVEYQGAAEATMSCSTVKCVNIQHFSVDSRKHGSVEERFWRCAQVCIHGEYCCICCWPWLGQYTESSSGELLPMASTNKPTISARRAGALAFSLPLKSDDGIYPRCKNYQCINPHHFFIIHKNTAQNAIRNKRFESLLEKHKLALAQQ